MVSIVYQSGDVTGPSQAASAPVMASRLYIFVRVDLIPPWVGINSYGGSNPALTPSARLVAQHSLLPHVGVFNQALGGVLPGFDTAACELLTHVGRVQWTYSFRGEIDLNGSRVVFLDVPSGFRAQLIVIVD